MEPEYPKYDEQIYNVVDQTLDATKQEDVVLAEKEFKEKRKSIFHELRNKDIKKIWHRTLWIFILTIPLALFIRLLLTPIILKDQKFSPLSYWLLSPLGAILLLLFIALTIFEFFQHIFGINQDVLALCVSSFPDNEIHLYLYDFRLKALPERLYLCILWVWYNAGIQEAR